MTPDQIARRYEELSGFELLDYAEAALPLWQLNVEAVSVVRRGLQPIKEFVLRSLDAGLTAGDLPGFLGLDGAIVRGALADLLSDKFVNLNDGAVVTDAGRKALREGLSFPTNEMLQVLFDGLMRRPVSWPTIEFAYPREVEDGVVTEIPATPPSQPAIEDLALPDVDQVLHDQAGGRAEMTRDILRLKRIVRHRRLFRRGVALVFRSRKGEVRTRFIVNGAPDEQLEQSFAEHGGNLRKGLIRAFSDRYIQANLRAHLGPEAARRVLDQADYGRRQKQVSLAALKVAALQRRMSAVDRGELPSSDRPSSDALQEAVAAERAARESLQQPAARPAAVYEHAEFLRRATTEPRSDLSLSSRGLAPHVVGDAFCKAISKLLARGVRVTVSLHADAADWRSRGREWARAFDTLAELAKKRSELMTIRFTREARYYHVAWDNRVALVANRPMLSNHGRTRAFDQFAGFVLQDDKLISDYLARVHR